MRDIRVLLQGLNIPVAEESFYTAPTLPYLIFMESRGIRGADEKNNIADRDITLEFYVKEINPSKENEIEALLNNIPVEFTKDRMWISSEKMYETLYTFTLNEKI